MQLKSLALSAVVAVAAFLALADVEQTHPHLGKITPLARDTDETVRNAAAFRRPPTPEHVAGMVECLASAPEAEALLIIRGLRRAVSRENIEQLAELFDERPRPVKIALVELAALVAPPGNAALLKKAAHSSDAEVRKAVIDVVEAVGTKEMAFALAPLLDSADANQSRRAKKVLAGLLEQEPLPDIKKMLLEAFPETHKMPPVPDLIKSLRSYSKNREAINWLFLVDDPHYVAEFRQLLDHPDEYPQAIACRYLGRVKDSQSFDRIVEKAASPFLRVRIKAVEALGDFADKRAAEAIHALLNSQKTPPNWVAAEALAKIPGPEASTALLKILEQVLDCRESWVRWRVFTVVSDRRDRSMLPELVEMLSRAAEYGYGYADLADIIGNLAGHSLNGDTRSAEGRKKLVAKWRDWLAEEAGNLPAVPPLEPGQSRYGLALMARKLLPPRRFGKPLQLLSVLHRDFNVLPIIIPVADEGLRCHHQYTLFANAEPVARKNAGSIGGMSRYHMIPFSSVDFISGTGTVIFNPAHAPLPGDYEIRLETRFLCTELAGLDFTSGTAMQGARKTLRKAVTLKSNRLKITVPPAQPATALADETLNQLARRFTGLVPPGAPIVDLNAGPVSDGNAYSAGKVLQAQGERGIDFLLRHFDPATVTKGQLGTLVHWDNPRVAKACEDAFLAGNPAAKELVHRLKSNHPAVLSQVIEDATIDVADSRFNWGDTRLALQALDGRVGPEHSRFTLDFCEELTGRLNQLRDSRVMRGGESIWGAFRTAFFLGRIGDVRARAVLRRAVNPGPAPEGLPHSRAVRMHTRHSRNLLLRWYAAAALKLIDVRNRTEAERNEMVRDWLLHCFSSPEEYFMARGRLVPYLNALLGDSMQEFYRTLRENVTDPWMLTDIDSYLAREEE